jgi:hypothetical protein
MGRNVGERHRTDNIRGTSAEHAGANVAASLSCGPSGASQLGVFDIAGRRERDRHGRKCELPQHLHPPGLM